MLKALRRLWNSQVAEKKQQIQEWSDPEGTKMSQPCNEITIEGVDQTLHSKLLSQAFDAGVTFVGTQARIHGITLDWSWDEPSAMLHITPLSHPFYISCSAIESTIREIVAKAQQESV